MVSQVETFEKLFSEYTGTRYAIAVNNGSSALLAGLTYLKEIRNIDYVITTPFSFSATADMIIHAGMIPVFVDIEKDSPNICWREIRKAVTEFSPRNCDRNLAILPVHLFGKPCNMYDIMNIAFDYDIPVIEDCSQALGAKIDWKLSHNPDKLVHVGALGTMGTFSFYASKNLHTFEGGMIITDEAEVYEYLRRFRNHGRLNNGPMDLLGMNLKMPEILAFIGQTNLRLHEPGILAELGRYKPEDGYYPKIIPHEDWYQRNKGRWEAVGSLQNSIKLAEYIRTIKNEDSE